MTAIASPKQPMTTSPHTPPARAAPTRRRNSFDIARFIAASLVVVSHSYALTGHLEPTIGNVTFGGFAVWIFFVMSGFLITQSWIQYPRFMVFMAKRALRIFPALIVICVLSIVALGFLSSLSYSTYLKTPGAVQYLNNILLFNTSYNLPGVFEGNVYPNAVNGSLWTLSYEFTMYVSIACLGALALLRRRNVVGVWLALLVMNLLQLRATSAEWFNFSLFYLDARLVTQLAFLFYSGVLLQVFAPRLSFRARYWVPALLMFFVVVHVHPTLTAVLAGSLLAYAVIGFCHLPFFSTFGRYGDFSYGIYVYAFVVQQVIAHFTGTHNSLKMFVASFPVIVILGALSWHLVEARCLRLKNKLLADSDYPLTERHLASVRSLRT